MSRGTNKLLGNLSAALLSVLIYGGIGMGNVAVASDSGDKRVCEVGEIKIYQSHLESAMQSTLVAGILGSAITVESGEKTISASSGLKATEMDEGVDPLGGFLIGSQTKMFTSAAIQLLARDGKLNLVDHISNYMDASLIPGGGGITIAQLLNHTSGMGDGISLFDPPAATPSEEYSFDDMLMFARIKGMDFAPGEAWNYNNTAYHVLGHIVEKVSGQSLKDYLHQNIFTPLGMGDTYVGAQEDWPLDKMNHGYAFNPATSTVEDVTKPKSLSWAGPAGDMASSLGDMQIWMKSISSENSGFALKLEDFKRHLIQPGIPAAPPLYGLGFSALNVGGREMWGHGGYIHGFVSLSLYDPLTDTVVTTFSSLKGEENEDFQLIKEVMILAVGSAIHGLPNCVGK